MNGCADDAVTVKWSVPACFLGKGSFDGGDDGICSVCRE